MKLTKSRERTEQILVNRCGECVKARFGDARDASECVAEDRDKIIQSCEKEAQEKVQEIYHRIAERGIIGNYNATGKYLCDLTPLLQALKPRIGVK